MVILDHANIESWLNDMKNKICLLFPYFGHTNNYFSLWLKSASKNDLIDFYFISDKCPFDQNKYQNIFFIEDSLKSIKERASKFLNFDCSLELPYKLCDYRPLYFLLFNEIVQKYDYWGFGDVDLIYGDLNSFVCSDKFVGKDCIFHLGHLSFIRNIDKVNNLIFEKVDSEILKKVYTTNKACFFDERDYCRYNLLKSDEPEKVFDDYLVIADVSPVYSFMWPPYAQYKKLTPKKYVFLYNNGKIKGYFKENGKLISEDYVYLHIMRRKMRNFVKKDGNFIICPNRFINYSGTEISPKVYDKFKNIDLYSNLVRFKDRVKNKVKRVLNHEK